MTLELLPVWWAASRGSRSTTATERPVRATACAVARPTMPPPTTTTSNRGVVIGAPGAGTARRSRGWRPREGSGPLEPTRRSVHPLHSTPRSLRSPAQSPGRDSPGRDRFLVRGRDQHRRDPHPPPRVLPALGEQVQPRDLDLRAGQRHPAELLGQQATDGVDVRLFENSAQLGGGALVVVPALGERLLGEQAVELLQVLDGQPRGHPQPAVVEPGDRRAPPRRRTRR